VAPPAVAPTVDLRTGEAGPPRRRPTAAILAIALAGAAIAGGGIYFALQRPAVRRDVVAMESPKEPPAAAPRPSPPAAAADPSGGLPSQVPAAAPAPGTADQGAGSGLLAAQDAQAGAAGAGGAKPPTLSAGKGHGERAAATRSAAPAAPADADADPDARDKLQQAEAALKAHDYDRAERLANGVINSSASARQRAAARLIHGSVQCAARNDQEAAQIDLRALDGFRALRAQLLATCRRHGMLTEQ
jgi:hypothetical protein